MTTPAVANARQRPRYANSSAVVLTLVNGRQLTGCLRDLSTTGCFLITDGPPPEMILGYKGRVALRLPATEAGQTLDQFPCLVLRIQDEGLGLRWA